MDIGADEIREWHLKRGFSDIGYHWIIRRNGTVERGRDEDKPGAHAKGYNFDSIAICLVGGVDKNNNPDSNFTLKQFMTLDHIVSQKKLQYPGVKIKGHRDISKKACPSFDVRSLLGG